MTDRELLRKQALCLGAYRAEFIPVKEIRTDPYFRKMCEANACGNYGKSYMCPPDAGPVDVLIGQLYSWDTALVYQTVNRLEDSYDFAGMMEAGRLHNALAGKLRRTARELGYTQALHLGAGGCRLCPVCGKKTGQPCRHPDEAMSSLEAYGINVSQLAEQCNMRYINGQNTVTYFGAVFLKEESDG